MAHLKAKTHSSVQPKLLDQVRAKVRTKHYSRRTEDAYVQWIVRFILFHNKRHPMEMGEKEMGKDENQAYFKARPSWHKEARGKIRG